jgi:hypothetical protein
MDNNSLKYLDLTTSFINEDTAPVNHEMSDEMSDDIYSNLSSTDLQHRNYLIGEYNCVYNCPNWSYDITHLMDPSYDGNSSLYDKPEMNIFASGSDNSVPIGGIILYCGNEIPANYETCDGQHLLSSKYKELSAILKSDDGGITITTPFLNRVSGMQYIIKVS